MDDSRKTLTAGEIEELKEEIRTMPHKEFFGENLQPLAEDHSRLLSLLTTPPDAAVREAVEELERKLAWLRSHPKEESANVGIVQLRIDLDILLSYVRAVQSSRLTPEQVEAIRKAGVLLDGLTDEYPGHRDEVDEFKAAFPELAGEVKRG